VGVWTFFEVVSKWASVVIWLASKNRGVIVMTVLRTHFLPLFLTLKKIKFLEELFQIYFEITLPSWYLK
jgi:hypothetical protein